MVADVDSPDKHNVLAERLDEAEKLARKILATQPENPDALNGLGLICVQQERFDEAVELFAHAHEIDPERGDFTSNLLKAFESSATVDVIEYTALCNKFVFDAYFFVSCVIFIHYEKNWSNF